MTHAPDAHVAPIAPTVPAPAAPPPPLRAEDLIRGAYAGLAPLARDLRRIMEVLKHLETAGGEGVAPTVAALRKTVRSVEPSVTMIGQVKAGKTSLVNAMIGRPALLPADINPWTSVVTSLHLSPARKPAGQKASFRFFSEEEWANLLTKGGRVGELAQRAGADKELETVRAQLDEMRAKSKRRLGERFEMLLGQCHSYGYVDPELVERYVCLGDEIDDASGTDQGRFADITRSADLYLGQPALPIPLCIRDTPGVNDTFMVREQITVNAIRASRLCVVVLSAHQALSTVDMALIRLISNIRARDVILFINRIDELPNPAENIPEIEASIRATLKAHNGPADADIVFGSAYWANEALSGNLQNLDPASAKALLSLAEKALREGAQVGAAEEMVWALSGVPALTQAISERVLRGEGAALLAEVTAGARNLAARVAAERAVVDARLSGQRVVPTRPGSLDREFDRLAADVEARLAREFDQLVGTLDGRLGSARTTFLGRATAALVDHLDSQGEGAVWTYDPAGLRVLLRSGYQVFTGKAARAGSKLLGDCADAVQELLNRNFHLPDGAVALSPPVLPEPPVPVMLGQTIALDIKGPWWTRWWRKRRSHAAFADDFAALIDAEIAPMVAGLRETHALPYRDAIAQQVRAFLATQRATLSALAGQSSAELDALRTAHASHAAASAEHLAHAERLLSNLSTSPTPRDTP